MARISTYQQDTNITTGDKLLGTDAGGGTKNFVISNLHLFYQSPILQVLVVVLLSNTNNQTEDKVI